MADVNIKYQGTSIATIDASGSKTLQTSGKYCEGDITVEYTDPEKPTQAKSATPTETAQDITPDSGKVLSKVSVGAIPKTYVGSGVTKKAAATVSPSTSEQTVCASGVYTTGAQKVAAITKNLLAQLDPDFVAANIKKDVDLFGLVGTLEAGGGYTAEVHVVTFAETVTCAKGDNVELCDAAIQTPLCLGMIAYSDNTAINGCVPVLSFGADRALTGKPPVSGHAFSTNNGNYTSCGKSGLILMRSQREEKFNEAHDTGLYVQNGKLRWENRYGLGRSEASADFPAGTTYIFFILGAST